MFTSAIKEKIASSTGLIVLAYIAFISLGLPDGLLGVAWPSIRHSFSRSLDSIGMLLFAATTGYLISSFYGGYFLSRLGVGWLLALSCGATGAGMIGYTLAGSWWMMIPLAFIAGIGAGAIDAGINTYTAAHFSERVMQWLHASFGIGITLGPLIMTAGLNYFYSWRWGYVVVGTGQILLALFFGFTHSVWKNNSGGQTNKNILHDVRISYIETLKEYKVWLSILIFFIYAGIEASLGTWAYTILTESRGVDTALAGIFVGSYWASFTIGRILAGFFTKQIGMSSLIQLSLVIAFAGSVLLILNPFPLSSLFGVAIIGFAIAPIFPGLVSLTADRVTTRYAANTIGMQISAAGVGLAVMPTLNGIVAQRTSLEIIPYMILACIIIVFVLLRVGSRETEIIKDGV